MAITTGSWVEILASSSVGAGGMSAASSSIDTANHTHLVEFRLQVGGTPPTNDTNVRLYRQRSDGTNTAPAPSGSYKEEYVGTFKIKANTAGAYFCGPIHNFDANDKFAWYNDSQNSEPVTATLYGRTKEYA